MSRRNAQRASRRQPRFINLVEAAGSPFEARWDDYLAANGQFGEARLRAAVGPLLKELSRIHAAGRSHRRIAPDVLWFSPSGVLNMERFGQAACETPSQKAHVEFERFRAPEEWAGYCDAVSDCYSVGVLLFEAVTGRWVPDAANRMARLSLTSAHFPEWSAGLIGAINRALLISRDRRFQSAMELCAALTQPEFSSVGVETPPNSVAPEHDRPEENDRPAGMAPLRFATTSPWTYAPSDEDGLFFKPDSAVASSSAGGLACFAASTRGRAHAQEDQYREDDFAMHFVESTGWHVFIVADGAASAELSRRGSQIVCESGLSAIRRCLEDSNELDDALATLGESATHEPGLEQLEHAASNVFSQAACDAIVNLHRQASSGGALLSDFATTFIAVLAKRVGTGWMFASFSVGDGDGDGGAAVVVDLQRVVPLSRARAGDVANRATSITMLDLFKNPHDVGARTNVTFCDQFLFLALMTGGVGSLAGSTEAASTDVVRWSALRQQLGGVVDFRRPTEGTEQQLVGWLQLQSPGSHDDQTLILAFPVGDGPAGDITARG